MTTQRPIVLAFFFSNHQDAGATSSEPGCLPTTYCIGSALATEPMTAPTGSSWMLLRIRVPSPSHSSSLPLRATAVLYVWKVAMATVSAMGWMREVGMFFEAIGIIWYGS